MTVTTTMPISAKDVADLERIEMEIEQDQTSFFRLAKNLREIRDRKLYLRDYKSFEGYCEQRWGWSRSWVYQQIQSGKVIEGLPKQVSTKVDTEQKARALANVPESQRAAVVNHAASKPEPVTARSITESAAALLEQKARNKEKPPKTLDGTGYPVPDNRLELWHRGPMIRKYLSKLGDVRGLARRIMDQEQNDKKDILFIEVTLGTVLAELNNAYGELKRAIPYAVCPYCQGGDSDSCIQCKGRGLVSEFFWKTCVPIEMRELRGKVVNG